MLRGEYAHNIDAKGRLIVPAKFREELGERFFLSKGMDGCLYVYPEDKWNSFEEKLNQLPINTNETARDFAHFFQGSSIEGELDKQGRVFIPTPLRRFGRLEKEVVFIGMGEHAEIWNKAAWDLKSAKVEENIGEISAKMEGFGFSM